MRMFSRDGQAGRIERCLFTAHRLGEEDRILPFLFDCTVEPRWLGFANNLIYLGYLSEIIDTFGWGKSSELSFNLSAKLVGRRLGEPERFRRDAVLLMGEMLPAIEAAARNGMPAAPEYDEDAFVWALVSVDIRKSFEAVRNVLEAGVDLHRVITTLVLMAADRMGRTPVNVDAGWEQLTTELNLAAALRTVVRKGGRQVAAKGVFHAAWQVFANRWINIPYRPLSEPPKAVALDVAGEDSGMALVVHSIKTLNYQEVGGQVVGYLNAGFSGERLLQEMGRAILWDDTSSRILPALRTVFDEWALCGDSAHPARCQLLAGLARYAADIRTNRDGGSAAATATRFADGRTTVEVFEA